MIESNRPATVAENQTIGQGLAALTKGADPIDFFVVNHAKRPPFARLFCIIAFFSCFDKGKETKKQKECGY